MAKDGVTINLVSLNRRVLMMQRAANSTDKLMASVATMLYKDTMDHFAKEEGPDHQKWAPLKQQTISRRRKGTKSKKKRTNRVGILQDTGLLRMSIAPVVTKYTAKVFTRVKYAKQHQTGDTSRNVPKRKFMYLSKEMKQEIKNKIGRFYVGRV